MSHGKCATDSAFPVINTMAKKIITPLKGGYLEKANAECRIELKVRYIALLAPGLNTNNSTEKYMDCSGCRGAAMPRQRRGDMQNWGSLFCARVRMDHERSFCPVTDVAAVEGCHPGKRVPSCKSSGNVSCRLDLLSIGMLARQSTTLLCDL